MLSKQRFQVKTEDPEQQSRKQWFALCTRARHEKAVREQLRRRGYEELLPTITRIAQWSDRTKKIESPLFPGYCFARFENWELFDVLKVPGICHVVKRDKKPESIPENQIEAVKKLMMSAVSYSPYQSLSEGMSVQIVRGPLSGVRGRLLMQDGGHYVIIGVDLIKLGARVRVQASEVIPVMEPLGGKESADLLNQKV